MKTWKKLALMVALGSLAAMTAEAETRGVTDDKVIIGSQSDLSGPLASWGVSAINGAKMRIDDFNAAGGANGRTIEFLVEDSQYQVPLAVRATNRLVQRGDVFAILLGTGTGHTLASYEITDKLGIPNVFPLSAARSLAEPVHPLHVSLFVSYQDQAAGAIRYFKTKDNIETVCLQTLANEYGEEVTEGVRAVSEELGIEIVQTGSHRPTETDFAGVSTAIRNADCDLVYLGTSGRDTIALYTTLRQLGVTAPIVGNMVSYLPVVATAAGGAMDGLYVVTPVVDADWKNADAFQADFVARYRAAFGQDPTVQSQIGWIAADLTTKALEKAGPDLTPDSFMQAILSIDDYSDPFGGPSLSFSAEKRFGGDSLELLQVENSAWVERERELPF